MGEQHLDFDELWAKGVPCDDGVREVRVDVATDVLPASKLATTEGRGIVGAAHHQFDIAAKAQGYTVRRFMASQVGVGCQWVMRVAADQAAAPGGDQAAIVEAVDPDGYFETE